MCAIIDNDVVAQAFGDKITPLAERFVTRWTRANCSSWSGAYWWMNSTKTVPFGSGELSQAGTEGFTPSRGGMLSR